MSRVRRLLVAASAALAVVAVVVGTTALVERGDDPPPAAAADRDGPLVTSRPGIGCCLAAGLEGTVGVDERGCVVVGDEVAVWPAGWTGEVGSAGGTGAVVRDPSGEVVVRSGDVVLGGGGLSSDSGWVDLDQRCLQGRTDGVFVLQGEITRLPGPSVDLGRDGAVPRSETTAPTTLRGRLTYERVDSYPREGCVQVGGTAVQWPYGTTAFDVDGTLVLYDDDGRELAREGDRLVLGGGRLVSTLREPIGCSRRFADFFVVRSEITVQR